MFYLADTHIALWAIGDSPKLPEKARKLMLEEGSHWHLGYPSVWEIAIKHAKFPDRFLLTAKRFHDACNVLGLRDLPLTLEHFYRAELLPVEGVHGDPFDRMLLAQARSEDMLLVTHDAAFAAYDDPHVLMV